MMNTWRETTHADLPYPSFETQVNQYRVKVFRRTTDGRYHVRILNCELQRVVFDSTKDDPSYRGASNAIVAEVYATKRVMTLPAPKAVTA